MATAVASSTSALITHAQKIASMSEDQATKDKIYAAIKETADATQGLLTAANMVGSSADYSLCQEQLTDACKKAIGKVEKLVLTVQVSPPACHRPPSCTGVIRQAPRVVMPAAHLNSEVFRVTDIQHTLESV